MMSKLGFGCAALTSLNDRKASISLLECAFESGITHFDVARLYGMGYAENIVGEFAKTKRNQLTITTKLGLNPPDYISNGRVTNRIKKILKKLPGIQYLVKKTLNTAIKTDFSVENATKSLDKSLRELKVEYIDYLLLHEANIADANQETLIRFLQDEQRKGKILQYGIGTTYVKLKKDCQLFPSDFSVFQFDSDPLNENILDLQNKEDKLIITHSALRSIDELYGKLKQLDELKLTKRFLDLPLDIFNKRHLASLVLYYSTLVNKKGITLFSSTKKENIKINVNLNSVLESTNTDEQVINFINSIKTN